MVAVAVAEPDTLESMVVEELEVAVTLCVVVLLNVTTSISVPVVSVYGMVVVEVPDIVMPVVS